jgi:hypothetical protein
VVDLDRRTVAVSQYTESVGYLDQTALATRQELVGVNGPIVISVDHREVSHRSHRVGKGAATQRIGAARRLSPRCSFNEATTSAGLEALGAYHEKKDEQREIGLGPEHDWSSHAADGIRSDVRRISQST